MEKGKGTTTLELILDDGTKLLQRYETTNWQIIETIKQCKEELGGICKYYTERTRRIYTCKGYDKRCPEYKGETNEQEIEI